MLAWLLYSTAGASARGTTLSVAWSTIDAGGGTSAGGNLSVSGSIAQIDADPLAGQRRQPEITGGFWVIDTDTMPDRSFTMALSNRHGTATQQLRMTLLVN
jgi:hypothetical protein